MIVIYNDDDDEDNETLAGFMPSYLGNEIWPITRQSCWFNVDEARANVWIW